MATFTPVDGNNKLIWKEGAVSSYKLKLFGIIPFGIHTIKVIHFGLEEGIYTNEGNTHVSVWNHKILLEKIDDNSTNYTDIVDIDAGWKTVFIYLWAVCFYSHRQKKVDKTSFSEVNKWMHKYFGTSLVITMRRHG